MTLLKTQLSQDLFKHLKVTKIHLEQKSPISSISFQDSGENFITSDLANNLKVYDCNEGTFNFTLFSKKYGVGLTRFTHHRNNIINTTTKNENSIRYHSLYDNKYIRTFIGHTKRINSLEMSPVDDGFISSSFDSTVRLWDLRTSNGRGLIKGNGNTIVAFDKPGTVFAVGTDSNKLMIYDYREFQKGPFSVLPIINPLGTPLKEWTSIKFSPAENYILITTFSNIIYVVDAFTGKIIRRLVGNANPNNMWTCGEEVSISPDGKFVMAGGSDTLLRFWDLSDINPNDENMQLDHLPFWTAITPHSEAINVVSFSPCTDLIVTGSNELIMWLPESKYKIVHVDE